MFFELLQVALGIRDKLSRVPSAAQWLSLLDEAQSQGVDAVMLGGIERLPKEQRPLINELLEWIGAAQMVEAMSSMQVRRARELSAKVQSVGFENCVLKGVAVAKYYPQPLRRVCGDIDLWVSGRRKAVMRWLLSQYEVSHILWHTVNVNAFEDVAVEIHFHPAWLHNPFCNCHLQSWFRQMAGTRHETEEGFNVMPVEFDVVYSLVHSFRHFLAEGLEMRHVCDYFYILKKIHTESTESTETKEQREQSPISFDLCRVATEVDKSQIVTTLRRLGMMKFAGAMMYVLREACGMPSEWLLCKPNEKEGKFLLCEIMRGRQQEVTGGRSFKRYWTMGKHYPSEVLWVYPWRAWHWCWRLCHKKD